MVYKEFRKTKAGLSLIEVLIVLALFISISSFGLFFSFDYLKSQNFISESKLLIRLLERARQDSILNKNQKPHGIFLSEKSFVLFEGQEFDPNLESNLSFDRNLSIDIETDFSESQIIFENISGSPNYFGTFSLSDGVRNLEVEINGAGQISSK